jgi:hypothetical protein
MSGSFSILNSFSFFVFTVFFIYYSYYSTSILLLAENIFYGELGEPDNDSDTNEVFYDDDFSLFLVEGV